MKKKISQQAQAVVEFAIVLPFFLMLVFGIIYSAFLFSDYLTLSNVARSCAREAAIQGEGASDTIKEYYRNNTRLITDLYKWDNTTTDGFGIVPPDPYSGSGERVEGSVTVIINTTLNEDFLLVKNLKFFGISLPEKYKIEYSMHDETS